MTLLTSFLIYAALFRVAIVVAGVFCIVLGYRLFARHGLVQGTTEAGADMAGVKLSLKNAAPGTCFALFGAIVIVVMLNQGNPELVLADVVAKASTLSNGQDVTIGSVKLKGPQDALDRFNTRLAQALAHEQAGNRAAARTALGAALSESEVSLRHSAAALNQLAFGYFEEKRFDEARAIASVAVLANPDHAVYLDTLAQVLLAQGEFSEALHYAERAVFLEPDNKSHQQTLAAVRAGIDTPQ